MRVTSRANATPSDGEAIYDLAIAAIGMILTQSTAELTARRTGLAPAPAALGS